VQRIIVEVKWGPMNGRKAVLETGKTLRVGASDFSDFVIPHDRQLSGVHFELSWDGTTCRMRDLRSQKGTFLGGQKVEAGEVPHGEWIRAGDTDFIVCTEGGTPPRPSRELEEPDDEDDEDTAWLRAEARKEESARLAAAEKALVTLREEATKDPLFAILDAARDDRILELLREAPEEYRSLYEGIQGEALAHVAPYLVGPMTPDSPLLTALVREGWGKRWGIYMTSRLPFKDLRRHWRRFLWIEVEETRERLYFRFYDPKALFHTFEVLFLRQRAVLFSSIDVLLSEHGCYSASEGRLS
jgi:pSer/pThr/pTyr-binding forkhead associated (FHA) protein